MSIIYIFDELIAYVDSDWLDNFKNDGHIILLDNTGEHHSIAARQAWADFSINLADLQSKTK